MYAGAAVHDCCQAVLVQRLLKPVANIFVVVQSLSGIRLFCDLMSGLTGSYRHGISQEWVAIAFSRGPSPPRN